MITLNDLPNDILYIELVKHLSDEDLDNFREIDKRRYCSKRLRSASRKRWRVIQAIAKKNIDQIIPLLAEANIGDADGYDKSVRISVNEEGLATGIFGYMAYGSRGYRKNLNNYQGELELSDYFNIGINLTWKEGLKNVPLPENIKKLEEWPFYLGLRSQNSVKIQKIAFKMLIELITRAYEEVEKEPKYFWFKRLSPGGCHYLAPGVWYELVKHGLESDPHVYFLNKE